MSVNLIGPDGKQYHIESDDPEALHKARMLGYRTPDEEPATGINPENYGSESGGLGAAARGLIKGATFGLVNDFTTSEPERELAKLENEEHPIAHGAGELAGMVLSPVNKVGALVEGPRAATALGRIGQKALSGAAVGSLAGAGTTIGDAALQDDPQLTAEKLLAGTGLGALLGGAGSGVFGAIEEGAGAVLGKLGTSKTNKTLEDFADDRWLKAAGGIQSDIKKIPAAEHEAVADVIRQHLAEPGKLLPKSLDDALSSLESERATVGGNVIKEAGITDAGGLAPGLDRDAALEAIERAHDTHGQRIGQALKDVDSSGWARPEFSKLRARLDAFKGSLNDVELDNVGPSVERVQRFLDDMGSRPVGQKNGFAELNDLKSSLQKEVNYKTEDNLRVGLKKQVVGILRDEIDTQIAEQMGGRVTDEFLGAKKEFGALSRAEEALKKKSATGIDAIRALAENASTAPPSLSRLSALEHARNLLQHGMDRKLGNRWLSASDYLTGIGAGVMHGGLVGALTGLASSVAHKFMRENGPAVIAGLADRLSASPSLLAVAGSFAKSLPGLAPKMGPYSTPLLEAAARGPAVALATHMTLAQTDPNYSASAQLAGLTPENPEEHEAAMQRAGGLAAVGATTQDTDAAIERYVEHVLRGEKSPTSPSKVLNSQDFGAMRMRREASDAHDKRTEEIRQLAGDPNALLDRVSANLEKLGPVAPGVAAALTAQANAAVQYLAKEAERPLKPGPLARDRPPTDAERHEFAQKLQVVQEPLSVLKHAAAGMLTRAQVDALKSVYPGLAKTISDKALERALSAKPEQVPYRARLMLTVLTGVDVDGTMSPQGIIANQKAIEAAGMKEQAQREQAPTKSQGEALTVAQRTATRAERIQLGEK